METRDVDRILKNSKFMSPGSPKAHKLCACSNKPGPPCAPSKCSGKMPCGDISFPFISLSFFKCVKHPLLNANVCGKNTILHLHQRLQTGRKVKLTSFDYKIVSNVLSLCISEWTSL